jgi:hypothetical protein
MWSAEVRGRRADNPSLTTVWARGRLREMEDRYVIGVDDRAALEREIVAVSLRFGVLCRFTAFVAVDRSEVVNPGGQVHGIVQPVEQPSGWEQIGVPVARKMMLAKQVLQEQNASGRVSKKTQLAIEDAEVESVDSMLMDFDDEEAAGEEMLDEEAEDLDTISTTDYDASALPSRRKTRSRSKQRAEQKGAGLIQRLLALFHRRKKGKQSGQAPLDRNPYRQSAVKSLQILQASQAGDASAKLSALRSLLATVEELFQNLISAGDRDPSVKALGEAVLQLQTLLGQSQPAETDVLDIWTQIENCLQRWLALGETTESPRRERFWK